MPLYHVLWPLQHGDTVEPAGQIAPLPWLSDVARAALLKRGAIVEVATPALALLPGWQGRAQRLAPAGVQTLGQLLDGDPAALAVRACLPAALLERWQREAMALFNVLAPATGTAAQGRRG